MTASKTLLEMFNAVPKPPKLVDSVVVVIDAQREYLDGNVPLVNIARALTEIETVLRAVRKISGCFLQ